MHKNEQNIRFPSTLFDPSSSSSSFLLILSFSIYQVHQCRRESQYFVRLCVRVRERDLLHTHISIEKEIILRSHSVLN